jgi:H+/gluconate symporter-like permease
MTQESIAASRQRHAFVDVSLVVTTAALVVSIAVAATVVSIGIARADSLAHVAESGSGRFAVAAFVAFVIAGLGGLTATMVRDGQSPARHD